MKTGLHVEGFGATVKSFPCMRTASFLDFFTLYFYLDGIKSFDSGTRGYSQLFSFRDTT